MKFSERAGLVRVKLDLQVASMSDALRNRLWNVLQITFWNSFEYELMNNPVNAEFERLCLRLWNDFFKEPIDTIPIHRSDAIGSIRERFFSCEWYEVYDIVEFLPGAVRYDTAPYIQKCNLVFEEELSAYRFVAGKIVPISAKEDVAAIEAAITHTASLFPNATQHLQAAISLLSKKPSPDFRNTIKESISAVEALCGALTGDSQATLGQALKALDVPVHPALRLAFEKLYGYTSDADGIRHALMEVPNLQQEDALFMLVACSAFISYVAAKYARNKQAGR
jgi:hypothetical protein